MVKRSDLTFSLNPQQPKMNSSTRKHHSIKTRIQIKPITIHSIEIDSSSLLLQFDQSRYLFNTPENTSRSFVQSRIPSSYLQTIFLSSPSHQPSSGLHGFLLGISDCQRTQPIKLIGPSGTRHLLASGRLFTRREGMSLQTIEFDHQSQLQLIFNDDYISVYSIGTPPHTTSSFKHHLHSSNSPSHSKRQKTSNQDSSTHLINISPPQQQQYPKNDSNLTFKVTGSQPSSEVEDIQPTFQVKDTPPTPQVKDTQPTSGVNKSILNQPHIDPSTRLDQIIQDMFRPVGSYQPQPHQPRLVTPAYSRQRLESPAKGFNIDPVSYLIIGPKLQGKFLPQKATALGLKPGPDFTRLIKEGSLSVGDGKTVDIKMCSEAGNDGSVSFTYLTLRLDVSLLSILEFLSRSPSSQSLFSNRLFTSPI